MQARYPPLPPLLYEANLTMNQKKISQRRQYEIQIFFRGLFPRTPSVKQDVLNKAWHLERIIVT